MRRDVASRSRRRRRLDPSSAMERPTSPLPVPAAYQRESDPERAAGAEDHEDGGFGIRYEGDRIVWILVGEAAWLSPL
jgi:hypothetical protein